MDDGLLHARGLSPPAGSPSPCRPARSPDLTARACLTPRTGRPDPERPYQRPTPATGVPPARLAEQLCSPAMVLFISSHCRMDASTRLLAGERRPAPGAAGSRHARSIPDLQCPNPVGLLRGIEQQQFEQRRTSPLPRPCTSPWIAEPSQLGEDPPVPFPHARLGLVAGTIVVLLSVLAGKHRWIPMAKARAFLFMFKWFGRPTVSQIAF